MNKNTPSASGNTTSVTLNGNQTGPDYAERDKGLVWPLQKVPGKKGPAGERRKHNTEKHLWENITLRGRNSN